MLPAGTETLRVARDRYLGEHGLSTQSYAEPRFLLRIGFIRLDLPNPGLLPYHDLHHVLTGYASDLIGEAEISVFELRGGGANAMVTFLCVGGILIGALRSPRRLQYAWRRCRGVRSLYHARPDYETLLERTVEEVRRELGIPPGGLAEAP
jgi:hypothetical protein